MNAQQMLFQYEILQPELQKQVLDFMSFLIKQQQKQTVKQRTVGEYKNKIRIHDDFDAPLSEAFWMGEE